MPKVGRSSIVTPEFDIHQQVLGLEDEERLRRVKGRRPASW